MPKTEVETEVKHLPLVAFSDRELLHVISDIADEDGWVNGKEVAAILEVSVGSCSSRLSWLHRFGALERRCLKEDKGKPRFRMNAHGRALYEASLTPTQTRVLEALRNGRSQVALGALLDQETDPLTARMVRREFRFWDHKRPGGPKR